MFTEAETSTLARAFVAPSAKMVATPISNTLLILFTTILSFGSSPFKLIQGQTNWRRYNRIIAKLLEICRGHEGTLEALEVRLHFAMVNPCLTCKMQVAALGKQSPRSKRAPFEQTGQTIGRSDHSENAPNRLHRLGDPGRRAKGSRPWRQCLRDQTTKVRGIYQGREEDGRPLAQRPLT